MLGTRDGERKPNGATRAFTARIVELIHFVVYNARNIDKCVRINVYP